MPQPVLGWLPKATCPAELSAAHQGSISWRVHPITRAGQGDRAELVNEHTSSPWRMAVTNKVNPDLAAALLRSPAAFQWLHKDIGQHPPADPKPAQNLKARWKSWLAGRGELRATADSEKSLKIAHLSLPSGKKHPWCLPATSTSSQARSRSLPCGWAAVAGVAAIFSTE